MTPPEIKRELRVQRQANAGRVSREKNGMVKTHSINPKLFFNALAVGRAKYGCDDVFKEPEFLRDCERWHPEIRVGYERKCMVGGTGDGRGQLRNRFGRVTERYAFVNGKLTRVL